MRKSIIDRDIMPVFGNRVMAEIGPEDLRNLCAKVKARGAPATEVHVRDILSKEAPQRWAHSGRQIGYDDAIESIWSDSCAAGVGHVARCDSRKHCWRGDDDETSLTDKA